MVLALVLVFILILFLVALITSALSAPGGGANRAVSVRQVPPRSPRREIHGHRPAPAPAKPVVERVVPNQQADPQLIEAQMHFTATGRTNLGPMDDPSISYEAIGYEGSYEGFFASANKPFTVGGRNDGDGGTCYLTGQRKSVCQCPECVNRRARG